MSRLLLKTVFILLFFKSTLFSQPIIVKGDNIPHKYTKFLLTNESVVDEIDTIEITNGKVAHQISLQRPGIWSLSCEDGSAQFFFAPGYQLNISVNRSDSSINLNFLSLGKVENEILDSIVKLNLFQSKFLQDPSKLSFSFGNKLIDSLLMAELSIFDHLVSQLHPSAQFAELERKDIIYWATGSKLVYRYMFLPESNRPPIGDTYKSIQIEDPSMLGLPGYKYFLETWIANIPRPNYDSLPYAVSTQLYSADILKSILQVRDDSVRQFLLFNEIIDYLDAQDKTSLASWLDYFKKTNTNALYARLVNKKLSFSNGSRAPNFSLADASGQMHTLDEFRGRYVFIDFWATWCGPCIQEMPAFHQLQEDYKDAPIVFLSISIDHDLAVWKTFLEKHHSNNLNLICQQIPDAKGTQNPIAKAYQVMSIPAFVLIDPQGKLAHTRTTKPSDVQHIHELFDGFLKGK